MHFFNFTQESKERFHLINCGILGDICHLNNSCTWSLHSCSHANRSILRRGIYRKHSLDTETKGKGKQRAKPNLKGSVAQRMAWVERLLWGDWTQLKEINSQ